jgi:hypothetical protein
MEGKSMVSKRLIISLPDEDKSWLEGYSKVHKISVAEAIRQGIGRLKKDQRQKTYEELVKRTRGLWKKGDGLDYQLKMRAEWERS